MPKIKELLQTATKDLQEVSESAYLDAQLLLAAVLQIKREQLLINYDSELSEQAVDAFNGLLQRRLAFEPIAYILGEKEFWGMKFKVTKDVLIPRPETELLVEQALLVVKDRIKTGKSDFKILELGTGSACIVLALAKELTNLNCTFKIIATDYSAAALQVAAENISNHGQGKNIKLLQGNWFQALADNYNQFDLILSNPPYIASNDTEVATETKKFEPEQALYAKDDGLADLKFIISEVPKYLASSGFLLLECGHGQFSELQKFINRLPQNFYNGTDFYCDLAGRERVVLLKGNLL